jgi:hypothetical protein
MDISLLTWMFHLNCIRETNEDTWARESRSAGLACLTTLV